MNCAACAAALKPVHWNPNDGDAAYQFEGAMWIAILGGYSMFTDNLQSEGNYAQGSDYELVICHECAHKLCAENPWLANVIQPYFSHGHSLAYQEEHPDHGGWDYDIRPNVEFKLR